MTTPVTPEAMFLAQLIDAPASTIRRTALPTEAFPAGPLRDIYRATVAAAHDHPIVTTEHVIHELAEAGRLNAVGGRGAVTAMSDHLGAMPIDGARAELVAHATQRVLLESSRVQENAAREGRTRDAVEAMQAAQRLVGALQGAANAVTLKSMRQHVVDYITATGTGSKPRVKLAVGALGPACGELQPGAMGLIYGFSQSGKSWMMQYLERAYSQAGYPTLRVSCEDPDTVNSARLVSEVGNLDASRPDALVRDDWNRLVAATSKVDECWDRRYVVEHSASVEAIVQTIRSAASSVGIKAAFVDYAQILRAASSRATDTQETRISETTTLLKETCKEVGVQLWLGSQVTVRDPKPGKTYKPQPYDLKGARSLYETAEIGLALWVDEGTKERFVQVQKDKINGRLGDTARIGAGRGGVFREMHACNAPASSSNAPASSSKPAVGYGSQRSDFNDD